MLVLLKKKTAILISITYRFKLELTINPIAISDKHSEWAWLKKCEISTTLAGF